MRPPFSVHPHTTFLSDHLSTSPRLALFDGILQHRSLPHRVSYDTHLDIVYAQILSGTCTIKDMRDEDKAVDVINGNGARRFLPLMQVPSFPLVFFSE